MGESAETSLVSFGTNSFGQDTHDKTWCTVFNTNWISRLHMGSKWIKFIYPYWRLELFVKKFAHYKFEKIKLS